MEVHLAPDSSPRLGPARRANESDGYPRALPSSPFLRKGFFLFVFLKNYLLSTYDMPGTE
jgi:hypothetical protein